ncbi:glycoside hydrolase family 13 protein [Postia placenta MAD-698-R-SB12]|uniref:alpha-amylase n=1 Tax=Postia placenta MAD-698-R-SB12 TaxID=670580 RepID=A0A1X6ML49_9APHY|nr:glycoside hydrolase family 13 protein [Postia placenta MAD-698-R-SB12]OSX57019.1 glycoside hydrolase family 13 protein [Postia placenta MAD-698-R-SB12]
MIYVLCRLLLACFLSLPVFAASAQDWQKRSIYQLVTDRFATSDGTSPACDTSKREYCNGTWQGVIGKLDYIQNMGFDAIWISPVVANIEETTADGQAYHGYWTEDQNSLNPHFGTSDDLKLLSTTLHERSMYLMIDVVVNHMAATALPPNLNYSAFAPANFSKSSDFHPFCWITDYSNQTNVEQCWLGDSNVPLADVDTEDPSIVTFLNGWIHDLVQVYGADGIRIDTVKHIRKDFWPNFTASAAVWSIGEVLDGDVQYVSQYTEVLDAVLDYPAFYPLTAAFGNTSGDLSALAQTVQKEQSAYRLGTSMTGSFLENQDNPRFQSFQTDQALVLNAMTWPFVQDGVPILYYGQEQGYTGANDPYNREALWLSGYEEDKPLVIHVRMLNAARKAAVASSGNFLSTQLTFLTTTKNALAVSKPPMLALLSNGGSSSNPSWSVPNAGYKSGETLIDAVSCNTLKADKQGGVSAQSFNGTPKVNSLLYRPIGPCSHSFRTSHSLL